MKLNLKNTALLSLLFAGSLTANAQRADFTLTIKPEKPLPGYKAFVLYKKMPGNMTMDSVPFINGRFELKSFVNFKQKVVVYVEPENIGFGHGQNTKPGMSVYLESGNILLSGKLTYEMAQRGGTPMNNDYQAYLDVVRPYTKKEAEFLVKNKAAMEKNDAAAMKKLEDDYFVMEKAKRKVEEEYFNKHLNSSVAFEWLKKTVNMQQEKTKAIALFNKMSDEMKNSPEGKTFKASLEKAKSVEIGMTAPDFTAKNLQGESISLSSFKGKYVLVDFWASWCAPCRRENPNVLKAYNAYKDKYFTVLAFSFDDKKEAWAKAVEQDGLPWTQVSDLASFYSPVAYMYGVQSIPNNFLINPEGKIIAMNLRGGDLEKELAKVM